MARPPSVTLAVNGETIAATPGTDGYVQLKRTWKSGDVIELNLPMEARRVLSHEKVMANNGKVALMRGPVVYCLEGTDHPGTDLSKLTLPRDSALKAEYRPDLLGGVTVLTGKASRCGWQTGRPDRHPLSRLGQSGERPDDSLDRRIKSDGLIRHVPLNIHSV